MIKFLHFRYWLTGTIALSLIGRIGLIDMSYLILDSAMVFKKFQVNQWMSQERRTPLTTSYLSDLETAHLGPLLPDQPTDGIPFHAQLLLPLPVLEPFGDGPVQDQSRRLFLPVAPQLAGLCPHRTRL